MALQGIQSAKKSHNFGLSRKLPLGARLPLALFSNFKPIILQGQWNDFNLTFLKRGLGKGLVFELLQRGHPLVDGSKSSSVPGTFFGSWNLHPLVKEQTHIGALSCHTAHW